MRVDSVFSGEHLVDGGLSLLLANSSWWSHLTQATRRLRSGVGQTQAWSSPGQLHATVPRALAVPGLGGGIFLIIAILMSVKWILLVGFFFFNVNVIFIYICKYLCTFSNGKIS